MPRCIKEIFHGLKRGRQTPLNSLFVLCSVKELRTRKVDFYRVVMLGRKGHSEKAICIWKIDYFTDITSNL